MAFRHTQYSTLIATDPATAAKRLGPLFVKHGNDVGRVAVALGVDRATVHRWLRKLTAAGFGDPRGGKRGKTGRRAKKRR